MKILFIAEAQSFMVNAIMKNLKEANFEVEFVKPKVNDIDAVQKDSLIILMYLGDYFDNIS